MANELVVLSVEDDLEDADEYKTYIENTIDVTVIPVTPPPEELSGLAALVAEHDASAVILDERLQQRSSATYVGIDALEYLRNASTKLPVVILTTFPHDPELKGRGLLVENLIRKRDLDDARTKGLAQPSLQELYLRMRRYQ